MRLKFLRVALLATTCLYAVPAKADPISAFISAFLVGISGSAPLILAGTIGVTAASAGLAVGTFFATGIGAVILNAAGAFALNALLAPTSSGPGQRASISQPKPEDLQRNFTSGIPQRLMMLGEGIIGGTLTFAEAKGGKLYKQVAHCDSELTSFETYYFDDNAVTVNSNGYVAEDQFKAEANFYYKVSHRVGAPDQSAQADLLADFGEWTENHVGAGVCDTLMTLDPVAPAQRPKLLKNRGNLGLGEPTIRLAGSWSYNHDPRDPSSDASDPSTWPAVNGNPALMIARHRMDVERFGMSHEDINWDRIAEQADICDTTFQNRYDEIVKLYTASILINKNEERNIDAEDRLLAACDGIRHQDEDGRFWVRVGYFYEPIVTLGDEDIFDVQSSSAKDGEKDFSHLAAEYTEPEFQYKSQASAVFVDPDWSEGEPVNSQSFDVPCVIDHTQAVRLSKIAMSRQNAAVSLAGVFGVRAALLREERFVRLNLASDPTLSGVYEIASVDEVDIGKYSVSLVLVDPDQWTLLEGEEGERPNFNIAVVTGGDITNITPSEMNIQAAAIAGSGGSESVRFVGTFVVPAQGNLAVQIQFRPVGHSLWEDYSVRTEDGAAASAIASDGVDYEHRWRVTTLGGDGSTYSDLVMVTATPDKTAPGALSAISVTSPDDGEALIAWTASSEDNYASTKIERTATSSYADPVLVNTESGLPNAADSHTETGLATGTHYYWLTPINGSSISGTQTGPHSVVVG